MVVAVWILLFLIFHVLLFILLYPVLNLEKTSGYINETLLKHYRTGIIKQTRIYYQKYLHNPELRLENILVGERCDLKCDRSEKSTDFRLNLMKDIVFKPIYSTLSVMNGVNFDYLN